MGRTSRSVWGTQEGTKSNVQSGLSLLRSTRGVGQIDVMKLSCSKRGLAPAKVHDNDLPIMTEDSRRPLLQPPEKRSRRFLGEQPSVRSLRITLAT
jgi:hypothetical protein